MKASLKTMILVSVGLIVTEFSCTSPVRLSIIPDDYRDTLIVYTDDTLPFNKDIKHTYDAATRLYKYEVFQNELGVFRR